MIKILQEKMPIMGVDEIGLNVLPKLRAKAFDFPYNGDYLREEEKVGFKYMTGDRYLPYLIQDKYTRNKKEIALDTVVFENNIVRAIFLPKYGGRLWSLYNKIENKEMLFRNPVFQPGNLAVRNAWVSGGIEWNLGQFGHTTLTMDRVYFAKCKTSSGREFIRMYDYERIKGLFQQIDFHLIDGDPNLYAHVKIINSHDEDRSLYWWTNTAVELNREARVISGTKEVVSARPIDGVNQFGHDTLPYIEMLPNRDATYPHNFDFASEYFFQNEKKIDQTWEMVAYNDGTCFYERSTEEMPYRKMFCWSNQQSGDHWQHFLATDDAPFYLEIQSGVLRSQCHGGVIKPKEVIAFTQAFGSCYLDNQKTHGESYDEAIDYAYTIVEKEISAERLRELDQEFRKLSEAELNSIMHFGSGFPLLEEARVQNFIPKSMKYEYTSECNSSDWKELITDKKTPKPVKGYPTSYLTDPVWIPYLMEADQAGDLNAALYLGIAQYENGEFDNAKVSLKKYLKNVDTALAYRMMAAYYKEMGEVEKALKYYDELFEKFTNVNIDIYEEYIRYLVSLKRYGRAYELYNNATDYVKNDDSIKLRVVGAAIECGHFELANDVFSKEPANIREGEVFLHKDWIRMQEMILIEKGMSSEEAKLKASEMEVPYIIDYRLNDN